MGQRGSAALVGGEFREAADPSVAALESVLWEFTTGRGLFQRLLGRQPQVWGRRRYGLLPQLPQILQKFGYQAAMHVAMDDGLYPDSEYSKVRWEGTNGTVIDAISRIPLAAEGANSYLRFPQRMAESMDHDQVATVLFARWPEVKSPWFDDLRRMHCGYSAGVTWGRFVTLEDYFQHTDSPGRMSMTHRYQRVSFAVSWSSRWRTRKRTRSAAMLIIFADARSLIRRPGFRGMRAALTGQPLFDPRRRQDRAGDRSRRTWHGRRKISPAPGLASPRVDRRRQRGNSLRLSWRAVARSQVTCSSIRCRSAAA